MQRYTQHRRCIRTSTMAVLLVARSILPRSIVCRSRPTRSNSIEPDENVTTRYFPLLRSPPFVHLLPVRSRTRPDLELTRGELAIAARSFPDLDLIISRRDGECRWRRRKMCSIFRSRLLGFPILLRPTASISSPREEERTRQATQKEPYVLPPLSV